MRYYTIQNNNIIIADNENTLMRFYGNVLPLPQDYEDGKYIVINNELILNPNWEKEQEEKRKTHEIETLKAQLTELDTRRIRAICENEIKDETTGETWLEYYNNQVIACRKRLQEIQTAH